MSLRQRAHALGVHHRNINSYVMQWWRLMDCSGVFLWTLSIRKWRYDVLTLATKATTLAWWTQETRVSLDRRKVTWKRIAPNVFDEKLIHFLMETLGSYFICIHILQYVLEF
jgi:hypothetical protein